MFRYLWWRWGVDDIINNKKLTVFHFFPPQALLPESQQSDELSEDGMASVAKSPLSGRKHYMASQNSHDCLGSNHADDAPADDGESGSRGEGGRTARFTRGIAGINPCYLPSKLVQINPWRPLRSSVSLQGQKPKTFSLPGHLTL